MRRWVRGPALALCLLAAGSTTACEGGAEPRQVTVAVVDTGIDAGVSFTVADKTSVVPGEGPGDGDGHGTEMATVVHRAAPDAHLVSIKAMGEDGTDDERLAAAVDRARRRGADVVLLALAGAEPLPRTRTAIARAESDRVLVVAAAGNDGLDLDEHPAYPAAYDEPNLIAVAAVDGRGALLPTSNRGPTVEAEGRGVAIATCSLGGEPAETGGTSAAAALVAGRAAQLLRGGASPAEVREAVEAPTTRAPWARGPGAGSPGRC